MAGVLAIAMPAISAKAKRLYPGDILAACDKAAEVFVEMPTEAADFRHIPRYDTLSSGKA
jgi:hypothetical protein